MFTSTDNPQAFQQEPNKIYTGATPSGVLETMNKSVYKNNDLKRAEHMAVRKTAGWYLFTHNLLEVTGKDAAAFLDRMYPNDIAGLAVKRARYTVMLDEIGEIIDDVVIFRKEDRKFWISTLFLKDLVEWFDAHKQGEKVEYRDITEDLHMYAVQGPKSLEMINSMTKAPVDSLKFFSIEDNEIDGVPVMVNRGGFTGEQYGYEIYVAADKADFLEKRLAEAAEKVGGKEITDFSVFVLTLPTEAGFYYLRDLRHCNPFEVGLAANIKWEKDFVGRDALLAEKDKPLARAMVGFTLEEADHRIHSRDRGGPGWFLYADDEVVGEVAKLNWSYVHEQPIGYAMVGNGKLKVGDRCIIRDKFNQYEATISEKRFI